MKVSQHVFTDDMSVDQMMDHAEAGWEPEKSPIYGANMRRIDGTVELVRSDDKHHLGLIGENQAVWGVRESFENMNSLAMELGTYISGYTELRRGKDSFFDFPLREYHIQGDKVADTLTFRDNKVGRHKLNGYCRGFRFICGNGQIIEHDVSESLRLAHTTNFHARLPHMLEAMKVAVTASEGWEDYNKRIAGWRVSGTQAVSLVESAFSQATPKPKTDDSQRIMRWERAKLKFVEGVGDIYQSPTCRTPATTGTGYGVFNAITEYIDRPRARVKDRRASIMLPESSTNKQKNQLVHLFETSLALASI